MQNDHFDLNDIHREPTDAQLQTLMNSVAIEANRRAELAQETLMQRLREAIITANRADRAYIYDNSVDNEPARLLFRTSEGNLIKLYGEINPWSREILHQIDPDSILRNNT